MASRVLMANHPNVVQECGGQLDRWTMRPGFCHAFASADDVPDAQEVDYAAACSLLVRVDAIHQVGTFDPGIFVFGDDIAWCVRLRSAGWSVRTAPRSLVFHPFHGGKAPQPWRLYYTARNQVAVAASCLPGWRWRLAAWAWLAWAERWARRWERRDRPDLSAAIRLGIADAIAGRRGRRDDLPTPASVMVNEVALPSQGPVRLYASGEVGLDLGVVTWWRGAHLAARGRLEVRADTALKALLKDDDAVVLVDHDAPAPAMAIAISDELKLPEPSARYADGRLVPRRPTRSRWLETSACLAATWRHAVAMRRPVRMGGDRPATCHVAPWWSDDLERILAEPSPASGRTIVLPERLDQPAGMRTRFCYASPYELPWSDIWGMRRLSGSSNYLMLPERLDVQYLRLFLAFCCMSGELRRWIDGAPAPFSRWRLAPVVSHKVLLCLHRPALRLVRLAVLVITPLAGLPRLRHGWKVYAHDVAELRRQFRSWSWRPSLSPWRLAQRWRIAASTVSAFLRVPQPGPRQVPQDPRSILVLNPDLLGDTLTTVPLLLRIREAWPQAHLACLTTAKGRELLRGCPAVDAFHVLPEYHPNNHHSRPDSDDPAARRQLLSALRERRFDVLFNGSFWEERSLLIDAIQPRFACSVDFGGFPAYRTRQLGLPRRWMYELPLDLVRLLGQEPGPVRAALWPDPEDVRWAAAELDRIAGGRRVVALQGMATFATRRWPITHLAQVAATLERRHDVAVILMDRPGFLWRRAGCGDRPAYGDLPLRRAMALLSQVDLFLGNEGGLGHIAGALGRPCCLVYTSIDPAIWKPVGRVSTIYHREPCSPCGLVFCRYRLACQDSITEDEVVAAAEGMLAESSGCHRHAVRSEGTAC